MVEIAGGDQAELRGTCCLEVGRAEGVHDGAADLQTGFLQLLPDMLPVGVQLAGCERISLHGGRLRTPVIGMTVVGRQSPAQICDTGNAVQHPSPGFRPGDM